MNYRPQDNHQPNQVPWLISQEINREIFQTYYPRNDNVPGYVYLLIAKGYHGIIPGLLLKRCKIGLSRNPEARVKQIASFEGSQPPCDIAILETVYVQNMKKVEGKLHKRFKSSSVKLKKSREWFDLWVWQIWLIYFWMKVYQVKD